MPEAYDEKTPGYMRMSIIQSCAVDDTAMTDALLAVLVALGSYASERNRDWLWASQETIARRMGKSRQYVGQATRDLADLGYVEIKARYREDGGRASNWVRLRLDYELPEERRRALYPRRKSGQGGRPRAELVEMDASAHAISAAANTPETPEVSYPPETPEVSPPETQSSFTPLKLNGVSGPETQWSFSKNLEKERGIRKRKEKPARATRDTPSLSPQQNAEDEQNAEDTTPTPPAPPPPSWLWSRVYSHLRERSLVPPAQLASWIAPCHIAHYGYDEDGMLRVDLRAPGQYVVDMIERKYQYLLQQAVGSVMNVPGSRVIVETLAVARHTETAETPTEAPTDRKAAV